VSALGSNYFPEVSCLPVAALGARWRFGRAANAQACAFGVGRSGKRSAEKGLP